MLCCALLCCAVLCVQVRLLGESYNYMLLDSRWVQPAEATTDSQLATNLTHTSQQQVVVHIDSMTGLSQPHLACDLREITDGSGVSRLLACVV